MGDFIYNKYFPAFPQFSYEFSSGKKNFYCPKKAQP